MKRILAALGLTAAALMSTVGMANASAAGEVEIQGGCVGAICGSVMNESSVYIYAIRDFDANGPKPGTEWRLLNPGQETPRDQDWDGFWVPCNASGRIAAWLPPGFWSWSDFSLPASHWRKISTHEDAHVRSQRC
ncbi:hypothetical protein UK23_25605 [Lentzea aerocolonigenes]|uniref:Secreted protein n=1 Tax=Lentzea aerocolonigenes TaxID=68170 RepID=A0A0F0GQ35_LENAE|nr:hypothetical protein [Lentzea aerocolonigenes]KJK45604.1 hypothetical protein UK23_25605 [Lentzea aerocolonigenes]